jgi:hypothetical protein
MPILSLKTSASSMLCVVMINEASCYSAGMLVSTSAGSIASTLLCYLAGENRIPHGLSRHWIQSSGWFVQQHETRRATQRDGQRYTASHSTRESRYQLVFVLEQIDLVQQLILLDQQEVLAVVRVYGLLRASQRCSLLPYHNRDLGLHRCKL